MKYAVWDELSKDLKIRIGGAANGGKIVSKMKDLRANSIEWTRDR